MKRTLDVAIKQYKDFAEKHDKAAEQLSTFNKNRQIDFCDDYFKAENEHIRLANECKELVEWLTELKEFRYKDGIKC